MVNMKIEAKEIDQFVTESLRIIGIPEFSGASLPSIPCSVNIPIKPEENVVVFKMTIGDVSR